MANIPCGPLDRSLLYMQDDHISSIIWAGGDRDKLDCRQLTARMSDWEIGDDQLELLEAWGFQGFSNPLSVPQNDISLIKALVERWRPETNTFHFPFGEMTITLEDVYMLMGLPVTGSVVTHVELENPKQYWLNEWYDLRLKPAKRVTMYRSGVILSKLRERYGTRPKTKRADYKEQDLAVYTRAYILYLIGGVLFPTSSRDIVHPRYIQLLQDPGRIGGYAWGAAVLGYLFRGLSKAAHKSSGGLNGCTMLLMLWAHERLLPGRPPIAPHQELVWPRCLAWAEKSVFRWENPHHHTRLYRGDFDSFKMTWLTWQPYERFYLLVDEAIERGDPYDTDLMDACHMALGRLPLICFEFVEYVMPDRVLRQFGLQQHIPEDPIDMTHLRVERTSQFQRENHTLLLRRYFDEWNSYMDTGMPITVKGEIVSAKDYMYWYMRVSKLRIAPCVAEHPTKIRPRDWFSQQDMADTLDCAMTLLHDVHMSGAPEWFYDRIPELLARYDRVHTEWKGLAYERPSYQRPSPARHTDTDPPLQQALLSGSHKRPLEVDTTVLNSQKRPHHVQIEVGKSAPQPSQPTPETIQSPDPSISAPSDSGSL